jgi:thiosulfate/3-mercaptopyruvate sulfurtransferase
MTSYHTLVSAQQLRDLIASSADVALIDTRFDLADPAAGERAWHEGHLPGSIYLHLDRDLCSATIGPDDVFRGRHPLPGRRDFARTLGRCGVSPTTQVVALDAQGGVYASRLWWMLRWMGHAKVAVLDGGLPAWTGAGGPLDTAAPTRAAAPDYPERPSLVGTVDAHTLSRQLGALAIVDARAGERFRGEVEPLDKAAGHIPGALNRFFKDNLGADGRFKPAEKLRAEFTALLGARPTTEVVHQCGSGVTACHNLLAMEHAALSGSLLYPGSWSEWSSDPARPIATG